tara:strand:+ start:462 stop:665 length:204 start_codon:yes stop_codon:yes gene_type:complete
MRMNISKGIQALEEERQQRKLHLLYSNKLNGIAMVAQMIDQELSEDVISEVKVGHMFDQIKCLSEID